MQIFFSKIKQTPLALEYSKDGATISGFLERVERNCVKLQANIKVNTEVACSRCGKDFLIDKRYPLELILSDGRYNNEEIDVIEFFDNKIDIDYIINSEIASIQEDYNFCKDCIDKNEILEIEF